MPHPTRHNTSSKIRQKEDERHSERRMREEKGEDVHGSKEVKKCRHGKMFSCLLDIRF
jgi:hypothetical protein